MEISPLPAPERSSATSLALESQGADKFFGEPALNLEDLIQTQNGRGVVNILAADKLMQKSPKVYATFLLWMLSELFENLPEIGDPEKPKLVFFLMKRICCSRTSRRQLNRRSSRWCD